MTVATLISLITLNVSASCCDKFQEKLAERREGAQLLATTGGVALAGSALFVPFFPLIWIVPAGIVVTSGSLIYLSTSDIEENLKNIISQGGEILFPKTPAGEYGYVAEFKDSEGNRVALFESK